LGNFTSYVIFHPFLKQLGPLASVVPYRSFKTSDGDILFGGGTNRLFGILFEGLEKPEWINDERFAINSSRVEHRNILERWIEEITMSKTTQEWLEIFDGTGLPYAKVNDLMDTLNHDHGMFFLSRLNTVEARCVPLMQK